MSYLFLFFFFLSFYVYGMNSIIESNLASNNLFILQDSFVIESSFGSAQGISSTIGNPQPNYQDYQEIMIQAGQLERSGSLSITYNTEPTVADVLNVVASCVNEAEAGARKKLFPCQLCTKSYSLEQYLKKHIKLKHTPNSQHVCSKCGLAMGTEALLKEHEKGCYKRLVGAKKALYKPDEKTFICTVPGCLRRYTTQKILNMHINAKHTDKPKNQCDLCGFSTTSKANVRTHRIACEQRMQAGLVNAKTAPNKPFVCTECDRSYGSVKALRAHTRIEHEQWYVCDICGHKFSSNTKLQDHKKMHP